MVNAILLRRIPPFLSRHRRGALLRLLAALLALTTVLVARPAGQARADSLCIAGQSNCGPNSYGPPALLNADQLKTGIYAATAAQVQSLQSLEAAAIANTLHDHGLPAGDAAAVQSWGRADAEAELFALLVQAVHTAPGSRTTDQQNAVAWLAAVVQRNNVQAAREAGLEYVKWAGLDQTGYQSLLINNATQGQFQSFLSGVPQGSANGGGYCAYRSPAPYGAEYTGYDDQTCFAPCTNLLGCSLPTPTYDQFLKWGAADANGPLFNSVGFARAESSIAMGVGLGGTLGGAVVGAVLGTNSALGSAVVGTALQKALMPFVTRKSGLTNGNVTQAAKPADAADAAATEAEATGETAAEASTEAAAEVGADAAGGSAEVVAGVVGSTVGVVITAIAIAVQEGISVFADAALPGQLAALIAGAPTTTPDLGAMLSDTDQATSLFSLFVGATLPEPRPASCDNSTLTTAYHISGGIALPVPCLNAPPVPGLANEDLIFGITANGSTTQTYASSLTWADATAGVTTTVRMSGNWFVSQVSAPGLAAPAVQTLRIHYTDWLGVGQTAWFVRDPTAGYKFFSVADLPPDYPDSCFTQQVAVASAELCAALFIEATSSGGYTNVCSDAICSYSSAIDYVGTDGKDYAAQVFAGTPLLPTVGQPAVSANPREGSPVTFTANGSSPLGLPLTYQWTFDPAPVNGITTTCITGCPVISGAQVSNTWPTSGVFGVHVTATDPLGKQASGDFTVAVGDVPPTLALFPACPGASFCDVRTSTPGSVTKLNGSISHTGSDDSESVDINWGDGTAHDTTNIGSANPSSSPNLTLTAKSSTVVSLSGTHTYADPGAYTVTVKVTDQGGGTDTKTANEVVQGSQAITFGSVPDHTYGDAPFTISATGGASGKAVTFASTDTTVCTVSGATSGVDGSGNGTGSARLTLRKAGTCTITANQDGTFDSAGTAIYTPAPPVTRSFTVQPAPLTITAADKTTPYGQVPAFTWSGSPWVNGDSGSTLATAPNSPPTCGATVNGSAESTTTPPGVYPGAIACTGAVDPDYRISYASGKLTINPLISLDEQGLPAGVPHRATLDGATVNLPDLKVAVPYSSSHRYSFPSTATTAAGTVYVTNDAGFSGAVTTNLSDTAVYSTVSQIVSAALAGGEINDSGVATALTQQFNAVQADIAAHNTSQALKDLHSFASLVRAQSGTHISAATTQTLLTDAQLVYSSLGGTGTV